MVWATSSSILVDGVFLSLTFSLPLPLMIRFGGKVAGDLLLTPLWFGRTAGPMPLVRRVPAGLRKRASMRLIKSFLGRHEIQLNGLTIWLGGRLRPGFS